MFCRACNNTPLEAVLDLGPLPIAHRLLSRADSEEEVFDFILHLCTSCGLLQIVDPIPPEILYSDYNYCFSNWKAQPHIADEIDRIFAVHKIESAFEIGANDGMFLKALQQRGIEHPIGLEPNPHAGMIAQSAGIQIYQGFVDSVLIDQIQAEQGQFDLVVARQVLEHIVDMPGFFKAIDRLLRPDGVLFLDIPDFTDALALADVSVLWEEHVSYFTESILTALLAYHGFEIVDQARYNFSGGTLAVIARRGPIRPMQQTAIPQELVRARSFETRIADYGVTLRDFLQRLRTRGWKIAFYGFGCRGNMALGALKLGPLIDYVIDDQPERQGLYTCGSRHLIQASESLATDSTQNLLVLLSVNQENEAKVKARLARIMGDVPVCLSLHSPNEIGLDLVHLTAQHAA